MNISINSSVVLNYTNCNAHLFCLDYRKPLCSDVYVFVFISLYIVNDSFVQNQNANHHLTKFRVTFYLPKYKNIQNGCIVRLYGQEPKAAGAAVDVTVCLYDQFHVFIH